MKTVRCPICRHVILMELYGKIVGDADTIIKRHAKQHTIEQLLNFIELDLARQANELVEADKK